MKLSKEVIEFLTEAVAYGLSKQKAAQKAGISREILYKWLKIGKDIHEGEGIAEPLTEYKQLCLDLYVQLKQKKAQALFEQLEYMKSLSKGVDEVSIKEIKDPQGDIIQTIITTTKKRHNFQAVKWLIEKLDQSYRDDFSKAAKAVKATKQEVTLKDIFGFMRESLEES